MHAHSLLRALGLLGGSVDTRLAWRVLGALCALYLAGFALFYPRLAINEDEGHYLRQAQLLLEGESTFRRPDPLTGEQTEVRPSTYPLGTAALMAPWVWIFGWRGGFAVSALCLVGATLLTARWIQDARGSPLFALVVLGFVPALVMGRAAMSDAPSTLVVTFGLWLYWRGLDRRFPWWLAAGFVAGASASFRPPAVLPFVPFFAGSALRRDRGTWALVVGGLVGISLRFLSSWFVLGEPFAARTSYIFSPETLMERLPLYALGLLVFVPGGLVFALAYRGRRRPEVIGSVLFFVGFFLLQYFSSQETGGTKRLVLALRYFMPLTPVFAFAMAESVPRLLGPFVSGAKAERSPRLRPALAAVFALWVGGVGVGAVAVHAGMHVWSSGQAELQEALDRNVPAEAVLVTNWPGTGKFLRVLERRFAVVDRGQSSPADVRVLTERHDTVYVALLDRGDSAWWRGETEENAAFMAELLPLAELVDDLEPVPSYRLRIWRL
ncbi:MAG: hypothetical protein QNK04_16320 [Myxococcota bacterium]|nr:hypothetical protein [Myxococcota bacterium]